MNDFLLFTLSILAVVVVFSWVNWLMLRRSFMIMVGQIMILTTMIVAIVSFYVATNGLHHLFWAAPVTVFAIMISLHFVIKEVKTPFRKIREILKKITAGDLDVEIQEKDLKRKDELGRTFRLFSDFLDRLVNMARFTTNIGKGQMNDELELAGESDVLGAALNQMKLNLQNSVTDIYEVISKAGEVGNLGANVSVDNKQGVWLDLATAINDLLLSFFRPLLGLNEIIFSMAEGDLTSRYTEEEKGDMKRITESLNAALDHFNQLLLQVTEITQVLEDSSKEMGISGEEMSATTSEITSAIVEMTNGAQMQVSKVDEASKLIEGILAGSRTMGTLAESINKAAGEGSEKSKEGQKLVGEILQGMNEISEYSGKTQQSINVLSKRSQDITSALGIITDIAAQTNLLALNAAIEAAQAGDAGRGFAVVAEEIRKLSVEAKKSVNEIENLVKDVQADTDIALKAMNEMTEQVSKGLTVSVSASDTFEEISNSSVNTLNESQNILQATQEQIRDIDHVVSITENIVVIAEQTAAGSEEVASSATEMSAAMESYAQQTGNLQNIAIDLKGRLDKIKLDDKLEVSPESQEGELEDESQLNENEEDHVSSTQEISETPIEDEDQDEHPAYSDN